MCLMGLLPTNDPSISCEQLRICRLIGTHAGKAIQDLLDAKGIANKVEQLRCEQVDELGFDIHAPDSELFQKAPGVNLDISFVLVEERLKVQAEGAASQHVEAE